MLAAELCLQIGAGFACFLLRGFQETKHRVASLG
jgi:hypothetical protein